MTHASSWPRLVRGRAEPYDSGSRASPPRCSSMAQRLGNDCPRAWLDHGCPPAWLWPPLAHPAHPTPSCPGTQCSRRLVTTPQTGYPSARLAWPHRARVDRGRANAGSHVRRGRRTLPLAAATLLGAPTGWLAATGLGARVCKP